ncbi:hypothetical protein Dimus_009509 [Dionaea muscipula]
MQLQCINKKNQLNAQPLISETMELNPAVMETRKLCIYGSFVVCCLLLLLIFLLSHNQQVVNISSMNARATILPFSNQFASPTDLLPSTNDETSNMHAIANANATKPVVEMEEEEAAAMKKEIIKYCDMFEGRWVYREDGWPWPRYNSTVCPFLEEKFSCQENGRPDHDYQKWVWENPDCDIPQFNGTDMLERLRGKRVILVGDSLNRNQFESLACLIYSSIPTPSIRQLVDAIASDDSEFKMLKAKDYDFKLEFYWSPFLVQLDLNHESGRKVLVLDKLSPNSEQWRGADIMVFNSGHWWIHLGKMKSWDLMQYQGELLEEMQIELAYEKALKTWGKWIIENVDTTKTTVFFRSISPEHKAKHWCFNSTQPIMDESYEKLYPSSMTAIIEKQIHEMGSTNTSTSTSSRVRYLNITKLSEYRIDAHPSVFRNKQRGGGQLESFPDCSHWCLPGLPDTWNRLLYASLLLVPHTS